MKKADTSRGTRQDVEVAPKLKRHLLAKKTLRKKKANEGGERIKTRQCK